MVKKHQKSMNRQLHEAIKIMDTACILLKDKNEYSRCVIPSLKSDMGPWSEQNTSKRKAHQIPETHDSLRQTNMTKRRPDEEQQKPQGQKGGDQMRPAEAAPETQKPSREMSPRAQVSLVWLTLSAMMNPAYPSLIGSRSCI